MTNGVNIFKIEPPSDYVYYQYRDNPVIDRFFRGIDQIIEETYWKRALDDMWGCRDIMDSNSVYMYFYARYYLGLIRPVRIDPTDFSTEFQAENVINKYDTALFWDQRFIWDDIGDVNPEIPIALFILMLRFIYNYGEETWTYDLLMRYAAAMCNMNPNDIIMEWLDDRVVFNLVNSSTCRAFIEYTSQDEYKLNFPFAKCYEFRIGLHNKNTQNVDMFMLGYTRPDTWPVYDFQTGRPVDPVAVGTLGVAHIAVYGVNVRIRYAGNGRWRIYAPISPADQAKYNRYRLNNRYCNVDGKLI